MKKEIEELKKRNTLKNILKKTFANILMEIMKKRKLKRNY